MRARRRLVAALLVACAGCPASAPRTGDTRRAEHERWRRARIERLKGKGGWLRLAGLFWLERGERRIGSGDGCAIRLPDRAPALVGTLTVSEGDRVDLEVAPGVRATLEGRPVERVTLRSDAATGGPDRVEIEGLTLLIIRRGGRLALRLFDDGSPTLSSFRGIDCFPYDPRWRVSGRLLRFPSPRKVEVSTVIETTEEMTAPGEVLFVVDGKELRLTPFVEQGSRELFFVFGDRTNGHETYGGGRFLDAPAPTGERVVLDFNRAYNPPCAFTPYATCPVPRRENRLPIRVTAGEKAYGEH